MKILYGIQGTGRGHFSRSIEVITALRTLGCDISILISGQNSGDLYNLDQDYDVDFFKSPTIVSQNGKTDIHKTLQSFKPLDFKKAINQMATKDIDLVITDFEPISARVARKKDIPCIGLANQFSCLYEGNRTSLYRKFVKSFCPTDIALGFGWTPGAHPILPPIIASDVRSKNAQQNSNNILIYLPWEGLDIIEALLPIEDYNFIIYTKDTPPTDIPSHITFKNIDRQSFLHDLGACHGIISNAGFGLLSEGLFLGKKVLTKPQKWQPEQKWNADALERHNLGTSVQQLNEENIRNWLPQKNTSTPHFPDYLDVLGRWIAAHNFDTMNTLITQAWTQN